MSRKEITITISAEGRDKGKQFRLREMSASQAEKWATKAFLALAKGGVDLPGNVSASGAAGIAVMGLSGLRHARFEDLEPLMDEAMQCVSRIPDPNHPQATLPLNDDAIEEVATCLKLRQELFALHTGFSPADFL
jgi:hypothetical protein